MASRRVQKRRQTRYRESSAQTSARHRTVNAAARSRKSSFPARLHELPSRLGASNREKAFHAGSIYRSSRRPDIFGNLVEPISQDQALEQAGISLRAARRAAPGLFYQAPGGEWRFKRGDTYKRRVSILISLRFQDGDSRTVIVYSYREASIASRYAQAVRLFREHKAGAEILQQFEGLEVARHRLLTDPAAIRRMAAAGEIRLDVFESGKDIRGAA